ncbi:MAG: hypothetical protein AB1714_03060 [Acidobacteriota bacterium]
MEENPFLAAPDGIADLRRLFDEREFAEVIERATTLLKENPFLTEAETLRARAADKLDAEPFIQEHMKEAELALEIRDYAKAISASKMILDLDPDFARASEILHVSQQRVDSEPFVRELLQKGEEYFAQGDIAAARDEWMKIESVDPGNPDLDALLARCDAARPAPRYTPEQQEMLGRLISEGQRNFDEGNYQEAINVWGRILVVDDAHEAGREAIARARRALEEQQRELNETLHRARDLQSKGLRQEAMGCLAGLLARLPDHAEARAMSEQLRYEIEQEQMRARIDGILSEARLAVQDQDWDRASAKVQEALSLQPGNSQAVSLSRAVQSAKRREKAERHYEYAQEHRRGGNIVLAFNEAKKAVEVDPEHTGAIAMVRELESSLPSEEPVVEELELEPVEEVPAPVAAPAAAPAPAMIAAPSAPVTPPPKKIEEVVARVGPPAKAGRRYFLIVSAAVFGVGLALAAILFLYRDSIFSSFSAGLDSTGEGDTSTSEALPVPKGDEAYMLQGQRLLDNSQYLDGIYYLQKIPSDSPLYPKAAAAIAEAQRRLLEEPSAPQAAQTPAAEPSQKPAAPAPSAEARKYMAEGRTSFSSANFERAVQSFSRVIEIEPGNQDARTLLSKAYYNIGIIAMRELNLAQADLNFRKALEGRPEDEEILRQLAVIRRYKDQPADRSLQVYIKFQRLRE